MATIKLVKKSVFAVGLGVVAAATVLADAPASGKQPDMVAVGGSGKIAVVNTCGASKRVVDNVTSNFWKVMMIKTEVQTGKWSLAKAQDAFKSTKANAAVFIVNDPALPISLVALESKWAVVNVHTLSDVALYKEIQRMMCIILGAASSKYDSSTLRAAFSGAELEKMKGDGITFDTLISIFEYIPALGVKQWQMVDREEAIEDGLIKK